MKADAETESAVISVVNQLFGAFNKRDLDRCMALFAPDPDLVFIGTGKDEKCIGLSEIKAELERAFTQSEESSVQLDWYSVSTAGSVAWVASDAYIRAQVSGKEIKFPVRFTIVLEQRGDKWFIVHSHDSMPAAGQKEGESWPTE